MNDTVVVKGLTKIYPGKLAVDDISFTLQSGCITGFLGPNGAGKTTTMKMLAGIISPTSGDAEVCGCRLLTETTKIKKVTGYLPETNPLYGEMRVNEYLVFRARLKGLRGAGVKNAVNKVVEDCFISDFQKMPIRNLSKGMRQRVGIADALLHGPKFLIFDEPTIGLDPNQVREIRTLLKQHARDKIMFFSSHILGEVESICDNVIIINRGTIVAQGTTRDISSSLRLSNRIRVQVVGSAQGLKDDVEKIEGVRSIVLNTKGNMTTLLIDLTGKIDIRAEIYKACVNRQLTMTELSFERLSLEEIFTMVTR